MTPFESSRNNQDVQKTSGWLGPAPMQLAGSVSPGLVYATPVCIQTRSIGSGIDDAEAVVFGQECVLEKDSRLQVVDAFRVSDLGANAGVGQPASLADGLELKIRHEVGERIAARVVVVSILAHPAAQREHGLVIQQAGPGGRNVHRLDLRTLIGGPTSTVGTQATVVDHQAVSCRGVLGVVRIRFLNQDRVNWKFKLSVSFSEGLSRNDRTGSLHYPGRA